MERNTWQSYIAMHSPLGLATITCVADVEAIDRILVKTAPVDLLSTPPVRSPVQQLDAWATQKNNHNKVRQILTVHLVSE